MIATHERRQVPRLPVEIPVDYLGTEFLGQGTVINASLSGVLIRGDYLPLIGTSVSLRLFPPDEKEPLSVARAVVRWQRESEFGVEIMTLTPEAQARLVDLLPSIHTYRGCVCAPTLPWFCRCPRPTAKARPLAHF
jgi:PilZ domain